MKKYLIIITLVFCFIIPTSLLSARETNDSIDWLTFDEGQKRGQAQEQKFFLYFYTDWCGYCRKLEKETFSNKDVAKYINSNFIPVRINSERMPKVAARFGVSGFPDLRFLTPKGENIGKLPGYVDADKLLPMLRYISTDSYLTMTYSDFIKKK